MGRTPRSNSRSSALVWVISLGEWRTPLFYGAFAMLSIALISFSKSESPTLQNLRAGMTDMIAPAVGFLSQPIHGVESFNTQWQQWQDVYTQNEQLRAENAQLKEWYRLGTALHTENQSLRKLLRMTPSHKGHFISAKMLGRVTGSFSHSQFLDAGENQNVKQDMVVISAEGLVGRIQETSAQSSRVLLLTDINSRIAVVTQKGREHALIIGQNDDLLELRYLPKESKIKLGEVIMTSGDASLMPANIPVGKVVKISADKILVKPIVDWSRLSHVSIVEVTK